MERIYFVKNGDLSEVNSLLKEGAKVKSIHAVSEGISAYGYSSGWQAEGKGKYVSDIYAYIVLDLDSCKV
ncbi:MAG: hypothetical protein IKJ51_05000 [Clostridia bacterium]|nr:hypothetical protein [Clostridia bacterium]MBR6808950.1 hypothetical protein [Clostridia bacterium]